METDPLDVMLSRAKDIERELAERPIRSYSLTFRLMCQLWEEQAEWFERFPAEVVYIGSLGALKEAMRALDDIEQAAIREVGPFADWMYRQLPIIRAALAEALTPQPGDDTLTVNTPLKS